MASPSLLHRIWHEIASWAYKIYCNGGGLICAPRKKIGIFVPPGPPPKRRSGVKPPPKETLCKWIPGFIKFVPNSSFSTCSSSVFSRSEKGFRSLSNCSYLAFRLLNSACASASSFEPGTKCSDKSSKIFELILGIYTQCYPNLLFLARVCAAFLPAKCHLRAVADLRRLAAALRPASFMRFAHTTTFGRSRI